MRALIFALLAYKVNGVRKVVDMHRANVETMLHSTVSEDEDALSHLGKEFEQQLEAAETRFLSVLEELKEDPTNETLQSDYRSLIGEVEWVSPAEESSFSQDAQELKQAADTPLGEMSAPGQEYNIVELLGGARKKLGRLFTNRRDYMIETKDGGSKYIIQGNTLSLHSRMHVLDSGANYKYVLRRSFNYLNPVAGVFGQYSYRVLQCIQTENKKCSEGDVLFTITKDRLGRGLLWGRDEWRVFTGTGGCKKWSSGLFSCDKNKQILYSLSSGISKALSYETAYYQGHIRTMSGDTAYMYDGHAASGEELKREYQVAKSVQTEGPPRILNLAANAAGAIGVLRLVNDLVWSDAYNVEFTKSTDSLLVFLMQAVQDLTKDQRVVQVK